MKDRHARTYGQVPFESLARVGIVVEDMLVRLSLG